MAIAFCKHGFQCGICPVCDAHTAREEPTRAEVIKELHALSDELAEFLYKPMTDERWATYHGFTGPHAVEMWRRAVGQ